MDNYKWDPDGWREYLNWVAQNKINIVEKIINLIEDILKNGALKGIGKPERLKHTKNKILYSRRIDQYNRLIYGIEVETNKPYFISCIGHYKNLKEILKRVEDIELK